MADKVYLNDGRVLEGDVVRETDGFIYVRVMIGGVGKDELVLRSDIDRIEKDAPAPVEKPRHARDDFDEPEVDDSALEDRDGATRVAFLTLEGMVGMYMNSDALRDSIESIEDDNIDVVVIQVNSGGGFTHEVQRLSDVIENEIKPKYRVVAWIESAISAAAMTSCTCEEIYFRSEGNLGAATEFRGNGSGGQVHSTGRDLEEVLAEMEAISARGDRNPLIMRAMQKPTNLSADFTSDGTVVWRNDLEGEHIVSTEDAILTFDSINAVKYKFAQGVADTKDELMESMGISDWVEAGHSAGEIQIRYREELDRGMTEVVKIWQLFNIAANNGEISRARRYLGQLKGWGKRIHAFPLYGAQGQTPPLNDDVFREIERQLDREARRQRQNQRDRR